MSISSPNSIHKHHGLPFFTVDNNRPTNQHAQDHGSFPEFTAANLGVCRNWLIPMGSEKMKGHGLRRAPVTRSCPRTKWFVGGLGCRPPRRTRRLAGSKSYTISHVMRLLSRRCGYALHAELNPRHFIIIFPTMSSANANPMDGPLLVSRSKCAT